MVFLHFLKKFVFSFAWKQSKIKSHVVNFISRQTTYLEKFRFSSYGPKCSQPIRLQDSCKCNISRKKRGEVEFLHVEKQRLIQVNTIGFRGRSQACPKHPK